MVTLLAKGNPALLEKTENEAAILFVDIEGCSRLCENLTPREMNEVIEFYFSSFFDIIQEHGGTVNEIMGDGFMAIFEHKKPPDNIRDAVSAAMEIRSGCSSLKHHHMSGRYDTQVHIGVHAGIALIGFTRFRAKRWERWTYTASGPVTNIAARLCQLAAGGSILLSADVAAVVRHEYPLEYVGAKTLKNVTKPLDVYQL